MDKIPERSGTATGTGAPKHKSHLKMQSSTHVKVGSRRVVFAKKNPEVLSPLVLSPYEDIECAGCPFILEEPLGKLEKNCNIKKEAKIIGKQHIGGKVKLQCSYQDIHAGRSNTCLTGLVKNWKPQNQLISSSSTSKRTSQGSFLGGWEFSSSDEIDILDYPRNLLTLPSSLLERQHQRDILRSSVEKSSKFRKGLPDHRQNGLYVASSIGESLTTSCILDGKGDHSVKEMGVVAQPLADQRSLTSGMELIVVTDQPSQSLSEKYRPRIFEELVGQELVVQALSSAILKGKIAPVYLFHGTRGTGKTSTARILAAALNCCMTYADRRPCTFCSQCKALELGKSSDVWEVDAGSHSGVENVYALVQKVLAIPSNSRYKVFIIEECHMLTDETWNALLNFLEEPPGDFVFILVTTVPESLPCTASSRCQKFFFMKVRHSEILKRLSKLAELEGLNVEPGSLDLIASRSDGSLRDAEMILDQLSLAGQTITSPAVLNLVGPVSDERLLNLLDLALNSDTVRTIQKAKELVECGIEPLDLITRLARLITDILAGSHKFVSRNSDQFLVGHIRSKGLERLSAALRILLQAEKHVKAAHHNKTAWLTAALMQLGHYQHPRFLLSSSTSATTSPTLQKGSANLKWSVQKGRHLTKWANTRNILNKMSPHSDHGNWATTIKSKARLGKPNLEARIHPTVYPFSEDTTRGCSADSSEAGSSPYSSKGSERRTNFFGPGNLGSLWLNILKGCKSLPLRHLLSHGKLLAVCFSTVEAMVHLEFKDPEQKSRAERYKKVIANTCKKGLGFSVNVEISLASQPVNGELLATPLPILAERMHEDQDFLEDEVDSFGLAQNTLAKLNSNEVGPLMHWQDQSGKNIMQSDYPAFNIPIYHAPASSLSIQTEDKVPPPGDDRDYFGASSVFCQEGHGMTWTGRTDEFMKPKVGYRQESPGLQEHKSTLSYSESVQTQAVPTLNLAVSQHGFTLPSFEEEDNSRVEKHKQESRELETQPKYEKFLCWRVPIDEGKSLKRRRRGRALITFLPCGKPAK